MVTELLVCVVYWHLQLKGDFVDLTKMFNISW